MDIKQNERCTKTKERLARALGNTIELIKILKEVTMAEKIDLLFYDSVLEIFYDKIKKYSVSLKFLQNDRSMIGKAFISKAPYYSSHILYDTNYNVSIDNPFNLSLSVQIIVPILNEKGVIGIIRFSKSRYTFDKDILNSLSMLHGSFCDIFSLEIDQKADRLNDTFFSIPKDEVYETIDQLNSATQNLSSNTDNPEIIKLITKIEDNIESISDYIHFDTNHLPIQHKPKKLEEPHNLNVLIADDVQMNVKILHAMIKNEPSIDISFAYDGIETIERIKEANRDHKGIDVLFLDHYMPGKLGLEIAQAIRKYESMGGVDKIIIISITNDPQAIEAHKELYDYHISKPFVRSDITEVMNDIQNSRQKSI